MRCSEVDAVLGVLTKIAVPSIPTSATDLGSYLLAIVKGKYTSGVANANRASYQESGEQSHRIQILGAQP